jgi:hypothetical protein
MEPVMVPCERDIRALTIRIIVMRDLMLLV